MVSSVPLWSDGVRRNMFAFHRFSELVRMCDIMRKSVTYLLGVAFRPVLGLESASVRGECVRMLRTSENF